MTDAEPVPSDITVRDVDLNRFTPEGDTPRIYYDDEHTLPSVSEVLDVRPTPEALRKYKEKQAEKDGYTDFYLDRGTLSHYELLNPLIDEELWSDDEASSEEALQAHQEYWDKYQDGLEWTKEKWEFIRELRDIRPERVLAVEHYVANFEVGYGGQLDLLWVDGNGDVVLGDIKMSKDIYSKYLYQPVAYDHALNITVDRYEILRMQPEQKVWEISRSDEWIDDTEGLWEEFKEYREQLDEEHLRESREQAEAQQ